MTRSGRPGRFGGFRALAVVLGVGGGLAVLSAAACLADLPAADPYLAGDGAEAGTNQMVTGAPRCGDGIIQRDAGELCDPGDASPSTAAGCVNCTMIGCPPEPAGYVNTATGHCYFTLDAPNGALDAAISGCAAQGAHVVTFNSTDEESFVDQSFGDAGPYWLPLQVVTSMKSPSVYDVAPINEPGWRMTCTGCYGTTLPFMGETDFPNVCKDLGIAPCVAHGPANAGFVGVSCGPPCGDAGAAFHAVCEREPAGLSGQTCDNGGGVCITLPHTPQSWYELVTTGQSRATAEMFCTTKGGTLVVFDSAEEREELSRELSARTPPGDPELLYWVGLQNTSDASVPAWTWDDNNAVNAYASEWADDEPSPGDTVAFGTVAASADNATFDRQLLKTYPNGDSPLNFVCEFPAQNGPP